MIFQRGSFINRLKHYWGMEIPEIIQKVLDVSRESMLSVNGSEYTVKDVLKAADEDEDGFPQEKFGFDILLESQEGKKHTLKINKNLVRGGDKLFVVFWDNKLVIQNNILLDKSFSLSC